LQKKENRYKIVIMPIYSSKNILQKKTSINAFSEDNEHTFSLQRLADKNLFGNKKASQSKQQNLKHFDSIRPEMEKAFGTDFSAVRIHKNDESASRIGALAYTRGTDIHFAPGQFNPNSKKGKELIGHELTHVIQQAQGRVSVDVQKKGLQYNNSKIFENEADNIGRRVARSENISKLISPSILNGDSNIIQRAIDTRGGEWDTITYELFRDKTIHPRQNFPAEDQIRGVHIRLKFVPKLANVTGANKIGLVQTVQSVRNNAFTFADNPTRTIENRSIKNADAIAQNTGTGHTDEGTAIDRKHNYNSPIYISPNLSSNQTLADVPSSGRGYTLWERTNTNSYAFLEDAPALSGAEKNSRQVFETTAIATSGRASGSYFGSVRWGWQTDSQGNHTIIPLQKVSDGVPSSSFMKAAELWNNSKSSLGDDTINLPLVDVKVVKNAPITLTRTNSTIVSLPEGTRIRILRVATNTQAGQIIIVDGPNTGIEGEISFTDWTNIQDERN